jgi:hypothetical protein
MRARILSPGLRQDPNQDPKLGPEGHDSTVLPGDISDHRTRGLDIMA